MAPFQQKIDLFFFTLNGILALDNINHLLKFQKDKALYVNKKV